MAEVCITGAMKTTPSEALDAILNLPPIRQISVEFSTLAAIRLRDLDYWNDHPTGHSSILLNKDSIPPKTDYCMPTEHMNGHLNPRAEILAINEALISLKNSYATSGTINIYSDSQAAIKSIAATTTKSLSLEMPQISARDGWHFDICLNWVPGHRDIPGNCIADESCIDEEEEESPEHFFCSCPALMSRRLRTLGKPFLDGLGDLADIPPRQIAQFVQSSNWTPF
ncbi:hypothetical protein ACLKA6_003646 [Drosophila palustris]